MADQGSSSNPPRTTRDGLREVSSERTRRDSYRSLVEFAVGDVFYAVPTMAVRAVSLPAPLTVLPHLPFGVVGVFEHRGQVVPVLDLRVCFGLDEETVRGRCQWVIIEVSNQKIGIVCSRVVGVLDIGYGGLRPVPELGTPTDTRNLVGVASGEGHLTFVLDVNSFRNYTSDIKLPELPAGMST